jgi:hypothetical protein
MLESVAGVNKMQLRGGRIYMEPYAFDAGVTYELAPDCAQKLMSSGKAVSFEEAPLPAPTPARMVPFGSSLMRPRGEERIEAHLLS